MHAGQSKVKWQWHLALAPVRSLYCTIMDFRILFSAWPRWVSLHGQYSIYALAKEGHQEDPLQQTVLGWIAAKKFWAITH